MPKSTTCKYKGKTITVEDALMLPKHEWAGLTCTQCGQQVGPHRGSAPGKRKNAAHFEHPPSGGGRNAECRLSDPARS